MVLLLDLMCLLRFGNSYVIRKDKMSLSMNETSLFFGRWRLTKLKIVLVMVQMRK